MPAAPCRDDGWRRGVGDLSEQVAFVVRAGPQVGTVHWMEGERVLLGRGAFRGVVLPDPSVSRLHAQVVRRREALVLQDLGSRNGTCRNGRRLRGPVRLGHGDRIALGGVTLDVRTAPGALGVPGLAGRKIRRAEGELMERYWYRIAPWRGGATVALLRVDRGARSVRLEVLDRGWRARLRQVLEGPLRCFVAGGQLPDGRCFDAVGEVDPWEPRAVDLYRERLSRLGLRLHEIRPPLALDLPWVGAVVASCWRLLCRYRVRGNGGASADGRSGLPPPS